MNFSAAPHGIPARKPGLRALLHGEWRLALGITALGFSSTITQVTVVREALNVFGGNELLIGLCISAWLLLTGAGALLGRFPCGDRRRLLIILLLITAVLPFGHLAGLRFLRASVLVRGATADFAVLPAVLPLLLAPYCLIAGYLLTTACGLLGEGGRGLSVGTVFVVDSAGDMLGGVLFSFVLAFVCGTWTSLYVPACLCLAAALLLALQQRYPVLAVMTALAAVVLATVHACGFDRRTLAAVYEGQEVVESIESLYGRIVVTRHGGQCTWYENGVPFASSEGSIDQEAAVHFVLAQAARGPLDVLMVSGALEGVVGEALTCEIGTLEYVELDPAVVRLAVAGCKELADPRVRVHAGDGRRFVARAVGRYDAIILRLPPPDNIQINRFYTEEFFAEVKRALKPGGMVSFALPGAENYINNELAALYRSIYAAAKTSFDRVELYPVGQTIFIASDSALVRDITAVLRVRGTARRYVRPEYLEGLLTAERIDDVRLCLEGNAAANRDLFPAAFRYHLAYRLGQSGSDPRGILLAVALIGFVLLVAGGRIRSTVASTGFVSIAMEMAVLLMFQAASGCVYYAYGAMLGLFMAGLMLGGVCANRGIEKAGRLAGYARKALVRLDIAMCACIAFTLGLALSGAWKHGAVLYAVMGAVAMVSGAQFPWAARLSEGTPEHVSSRLYMADFIGAATGSLLCTLLLIPLTGIIGVLISVCIIKVVNSARILAWR